MHPDQPPDQPTPSTERATQGAALQLKSNNGLGRVWRAMTYSGRGIAAAWQHEAAFRQEVILGVPLIVLAPFLATQRWELAAMIGSVVLVWLVEFINSALEALADAVSLEMDPRLGRAKDLGSAAVSVALLIVVLVWATVLWP